MGLDFGILNDRFYGAIEWYRKETSDLINRIPIPGGSNFSNFLVTNVGETESNGLEVSLNGTVVSSNDITWNAGVNFTSYSNKITKLTLVDDPDYPGVAVGDISGGVGNTVQIHTVGFPANSFYVFEQVYDESGNPVEGLYVDLSGEQGEVSSNQLNKYRYKNPAPELTFGINSRVDIYNFDFSFSGRISLNNYVYNNIQSSAILNELYLSTEGGFFTNIPSDAADIGFASAQYWSDLYVENASFFKLDNISLGYTLPITEAIDSRISFTVQNALILTKYSGLDPEVNGGIDNNIYPRPRTFLLGVGLNF